VAKAKSVLTARSRWSICWSYTSKTSNKV